MYEANEKNGKSNKEEYPKLLDNQFKMLAVVDFSKLFSFDATANPEKIFPKNVFSSIKNVVSTYNADVNKTNAIGLKCCFLFPLKNSLMVCPGLIDNSFIV